MAIVQENGVTEKELPGRFLRWLVPSEQASSERFSLCVIRVPVGETVRPAHSHPNGAEIIYIIRGKGQVLVDGEKGDVREGIAVLFPQGSVHMLRNTGDEEMKVVCFFTPPSDLSTYEFFDEVSFPD